MLLLRVKKRISVVGLFSLNHGSRTAFLLAPINVDEMISINKDY